MIRTISRVPLGQTPDGTTPWWSPYPHGHLSIVAEPTAGSDLMRTVLGHLVAQAPDLTTEALPEEPTDTPEPWRITIITTPDHVASWRRALPDQVRVIADPDQIIDTLLSLGRYVRRTATADHRHYRWTGESLHESYPCHILGVDGADRLPDLLQPLPQGAQALYRLRTIIREGVDVGVPTIQTHTQMDPGGDTVALLSPDHDRWSIRYPLDRWITDVRAPEPAHTTT